MFPPLTLEGTHVRLEPLALAHVPALAGAASGPRGTYALTWVPEGEAAMRRYVEEARDQTQNTPPTVSATPERTKLFELE